MEQTVEVYTTLSSRILGVIHARRKSIGSLASPWGRSHTLAHPESFGCLHSRYSTPQYTRSLHRLKAFALTSSACCSNASSSLSIGSDNSACPNLSASSHSVRFVKIAVLSGDGRGDLDLDDLLGDSKLVVRLRRRRFLPGLSVDGDVRLEGLVSGTAALDSCTPYCVRIGIVMPMFPGCAGWFRGMCTFKTTIRDIQ